MTPATSDNVRPRTTPVQFIALAAIVGIGMACLGVFSTWPAYHPLPPETALLRLSFSHPGRIVGDCRQRTAEELAKLPPQRRVATECPRERSPVRVRVEVDGREILAESFAPAGFSRDGAATGYRRMPIAAGHHRIRAQLADDVRVVGYNYEREIEIDARPGRIVLIDFAPDRGGVIIQ